MNLVCLNGAFVPSDQPLFTIGNRGFKYGDGVFETIKVSEGRILLEALHFERLQTSLRLLQIGECPDQALISKNILELCERNGCSSQARVRLAVYRNDNGSAGFAVEAVPLDAAAHGWNEKGWVIDIYPYARKSMDAFSNLKTANFLPYVMAGRYALENGLDDCLVLNTDNHIADASRANIFLVRNGELFTPALHQGCVNGVMRRYLIDVLKKMSFRVRQEIICEKDVLEADEVFLTNAIIGIRWVGSFREKRFGHSLTSSIYNRVFSTIPDPACYTSQGIKK